MKERLGKRREYRQKKKGNKPQADEFYSYNARGEKVYGKYNEKGEFIVDMAYRKPGTCDKQGFLLDKSGSRVVNSKIKDRMKKRELQNKNMGGAKGSMERNKKRSISRGSLEEHVDPSKMYDYFRE